MKRTKLFILTFVMAALGLASCEINIPIGGSINSLHMHEYIKEVIEPTCTEQGFTLCTCDCGDQYTEEYTAALGHDYLVKEAVDPTYDVKGRIVYECSRCGASFFEETDELKHHYSNTWSSDKSSHFHSCTDQGYEDLKIDIGQHEYTAQVTELSTIYTCSVCGHSYEEYVILPRQKTEYKPICKKNAPANGDEILFVEGGDKHYTLNKTEEGWFIVNDREQKLGVTETGQVTLDEGIMTWMILSAFDNKCLIYSTYRINNNIMYLTYDLKTGDFGTNSSNNKAVSQVYKKINTDLIYPADLNIKGKAELSLGKKKNVSVEYSPSNINVENNITWSSSNEAVVSVNDGALEAKALGTATITAKIITADENYRAKCLTDSFDVEVVPEASSGWTIMVYLCGADLESNNSFATKDIKEIISVDNQPEDVNIIIETGGARSWHYTGISSNKLGRYHVRDKKLILDEQIANASMGNQSTLESFLNWGLNNYPAERTGVIFWNHGGALDGVCFDENYGSDGLTNLETSQAFKNVFESNGITKLDFVGYDACLMQIQDVAEFNSHYFNYMIGSEEAEAGDGWVYNKWLDDVYSDQDIDLILKENCSSFVSAYGSDQTLSYLDLTKMEDYYIKFENLSGQLYTTVKANYSSFKSLIKKVKDFGDTGYYSGLESYGSVDGLDFLNKLSSSSLFSSYLEEIEEVKAAYNNVVKYSKRGRSAGNANGLAIIAATSISYPASQTSFQNWRKLFI